MSREKGRQISELRRGGASRWYDKTRPKGKDRYNQNRQAIELEDEMILDDLLNDYYNDGWDYGLDYDYGLGDDYDEDYEYTDPYPPIEERY